MKGQKQKNVSNTDGKPKVSVFDDLGLSTSVLTENKKRKC